MVTKLADHVAKRNANTSKTAPGATAKLGDSIKVKELSFKTADDVAKVAREIKSAGSRSRTLLQAASVGVIKHMAEHGDYTIVYPLTSAALSLGRNLSTAWFGWMQEHSWLRIPEGMNARSIAANEKEPAKIWQRDAKLKPADNTQLLEKALAPRPVTRNGKQVGETQNVFWTYQAPRKPRDMSSVNVPDKVARFFKSLQEAIDAGTAVNADDKAMDFDAVYAMVSKGLQDMKRPAPKQKAEPRQRNKNKTSEGKVDNQVDTPKAA